MKDEGFLRRVLVAVDSSLSSVMAEETAAIIAKRTGATVTVLHIKEEIELEHLVPRNIADEIRGHLEQKAEKTINDARALFSEEGVTVDTKTLGGSDPADSILGFSKDRYDLIVMGAHGENEKDPFAIGSVTKKVIRHTKCPTLFVKKVSSLSNLLVGVDGSEHSIKALNYAVKLGERVGSKLTLLNVQDHRLYDVSPKTAQEAGQRILSKALKAVGKEEMKVDKRLTFGVLSDKIVEIAEERNHDLIVLGSRGLGTVKRFLLGSVSEDVSHKAKCSVLIIPTKDN